MLNDKDIIVLQKLIVKKNTNMDDLARYLFLSKRQLNYSIEKINDYILKDKGIVIENDKIIITKKIETYLENFLTKKKYIGDIAFTKETRRLFILLFLISYKDFISSYHLVEMFNSSKTTIQNDLNFLKNELYEYNLSIDYSNKSGYIIKGDEEDIRIILIHNVINIIMDSDNEILLNYFVIHFLKKDFPKFLNEINHLSKKHNINFFENNLKIFAYSLVLLINRLVEEEVDFLKLSEEIPETKEYNFATDFLRLHNIFNENSVIYLSYWLVGLSLGDVNEKTSDRDNILDIINRFIVNFESIAGVTLEKPNEIKRNLYMHFRPAYYRMLFKFPIYNPSTVSIKKEYSSTYKLVKESIKLLELNYLLPVPDDEIAYLTTHVAYFTYEKKKQNKYTNRAAIICPIGIGTSSILKAQLEEIFPNINFVSYANYESQDFDILFSTIVNKNLLNIKKPIFFVNPIMSKQEKKKLITDVNTILYDKKANEMMTIQKLMDIVDDYVSKETYQNIYKDVQKHLIKSNNIVKRKEDSYLLSEIIAPELIKLDVQATDWESAIRNSVKPLLDYNKVTSNYVDSMIDLAKENGPYIVISENVALPHARPESGALEVAISIATLEKPVEFGNKANDPVKYIFGLSAIDSTSHLNAMAELSELLEDKDFYELLDTSDSPEEVYMYIKNKKYIK